MLSVRAAARRHNGSYPLPVRREALRHLQTATVTPSSIAHLASQPLHPLTLSDLCQQGRPPLSTPSLLASANFTLSLLPARLAHRIEKLRSLPYIVVANPHVSKILSNYTHSLSTLLPYAERHIETLNQEIEFTSVMADLVRTHSNTIGTLARGFLEARKYISAAHVTSFLDEHLRQRIGTRLIAEQHIALHYSSTPHSELSPEHAYSHSTAADSTYIGVIDTALRPIDIIRSCEETVGEICELKYGVRPSIRILGEESTSVAQIPMHLEYILTELLKNSFRAVIEAGTERDPIEITIAPAPVQDDNTPAITLRIRDRGGGISAPNLAKLWEYGFTTFNDEEINDKTASNTGDPGLGGLDALAGGGSSLAGLGYGLPLGRAYAEYFGGGIEVQSLWGWGTDVYLCVRGIGKVG